MLRKNVKTILAGIFMVVLTLAAPVANAGVLVTDGRNIDPGAAGEDNTATAKRADAEENAVEEEQDKADLAEACPRKSMSPVENEIYLLMAAVLNSPEIYVEDGAEEQLVTLSAAIDAPAEGDAAGGCAASPASLAGLVAGGLLLRRRRRRNR